MTNKKIYSIDDLLDIMARLRNPDGGCPWDLAQTFDTIAPYTIEESYEVADAIERGDTQDLTEELGDLLLQVVYHTQMAVEQNIFSFSDVVQAISEKMIHRHPHVFGDGKAKSPEDVNAIWEQRKDGEDKRRKAESILNDVALNLPGLLRAQKLQSRVARVGFEWAQPGDVLDKLEEELGEMREALRDGKTDEIRDELGDLFFVLVNFGRMMGIDCEETMRQANRKFSRRFQAIESGMKREGLKWEETSLEKMETFWQEEKKREKAAKKSQG